MAYLQGVDVASYQSETYDASGLAFAFVKSTQGTNYVNPKHAAQVAQIRNVGGIAGHYLFMSTDSAASQAAFFDAHTHVNPGELIAVDWESDNGVWPSNALKDQLLKALKARYPNNKVGLYTNRDGWLNQDRTSYCGDFLWIADPGTPGAPRVKHHWTFHQYSIANGIDRDVANFTTMDDFRKWAGMSVATVSEKPNQTYRDVMLDDVFPLPKGHVDGDNNGAWTLQTVISSMYEMVAETHSMVSEIYTKVVKS